MPPQLMRTSRPRVVAHIAKWAADDPDRPAVTDRDGTIMFGQLWRDSGSWAALLARHGVREGEAVGLVLPNRKQFVPILLGIARVDAVAVLFPPALTASDLRRYGGIAGTRLVLASVAHQTLVLEAGGRSCPHGFEALRRFTFPVPRAAGLARGDWIVQLTSGADQPSKLAVRTHDAVWNEIDSFAEEIQLLETDTTLVLSSISHSYGLIGGTLASLCRGGRVILHDGFDPHVVLREIWQEQPTILFAVPAVYRGLLHTPACEGEALLPLRLCFSAGAPLPHDLDDSFALRFGRRICQDYGSTEAGVITLRLTWTPYLRDSVGRPVRGRDIAVVGPQGHELEPGAVGEVVVASSALARGYLDDTSSLVPIDPNRFHTGDLGWRDETGHLFLVGRKSSLVHVADAVVDPAMVEAVIAGIPGVEDAAVVGIADPAGNGRVKAVVVAEGITGDQIIRHCRERLPATHVPQAVEFRTQIPRTAAGKTLRRLLR
jgi:acyl-CoA synthetase (AMP-forming)/AMP-acid ligase II